MECRVDQLFLDIMKQLTILYVEDDDRLRESNAKLLKKIFLRVDTAEDGEEGLFLYKQFYRQKKESYDLVITDIKMPKLNGVVLVEEIYKKNPKQNIIVQSAYNDSAYLEKFIDMGVDAFIKKPSEFEEYIDKIMKVCLTINAYHQKELCIIKMDQLNQELEEKVAQRTKELEELVHTDSLSGYGNRYKLTQDISTSVTPALALLNIDNFSAINDFYGYEKGDDVLKQVSNAIGKNLIYDGSELYHMQGDEFVIFNKDTAKTNFLKVIEDVIHKFNQTRIILDTEEIYIQISTVVSFEDKQRILTTANMGKKILKREHKSFLVYDETLSLDSEYENNFKWVKKITTGLKEDNFIPVFQPIVNNKTKVYEKYECLVRLEDDERLYTPSNFLDISKQTKHYMDITKIMLRKSFGIFKNSTKEFSINLTIEDILNNEMTDFIFEMLEEYKIGSRVVFEIVESESIENFESVISFIEKINLFGCKVAIDDFGTGYSNFEYLLKLKADYIKIDGSLIKNIDESKEAEQVVSTIVDFAQKIGIKTIAEFVESESIYKKVTELGIDYSQGYYFGKPSGDDKKLSVSN